MLQKLLYLSSVEQYEKDLEKIKNDDIVAESNGADTITDDHGELDTTLVTDTAESHSVTVSVDIHGAPDRDHIGATRLTVTNIDCSVAQANAGEGSAAALADVGLNDADDITVQTQNVESQTHNAPFKLIAAVKQRGRPA